MGTGVLDQLFQQDAFLSDLRKIVALPAGTLSEVLEGLRSIQVDPDALTTEEVIDEIAGRTGESAGTIRSAVAFGGIAVSVLSSEQSTLDRIRRRIANVLAPGQIPEAYVGHLEGLQSLVSIHNEARERRSILWQGGRTLHEVTTVVDLRVRTKVDDSASEQIDKYKPQVVELVPVVILRLSFASADDGDDCTVQLTASDLGSLITDLRRAEKELQAALSAVTLNKV